VANRTASALRGEAQLISPFGSWAETRPWSQAFSAEPGRSATIVFTVAVPATARPGQHWWALIKVMYFGRLRYSEPAAVTISRLWPGRPCRPARARWLRGPRPWRRP